MTTQEWLYTAEELLHLPEDSHRSALVRGRLIELPFHGGIHGLVTGEILYLLGVFIEKHNLGRLYAGGTGFQVTVNPDTVYGMDVIYMSKTHTRPIADDYITEGPDLIVEIYSPSNALIEMQYKIEDCFRAGTRLFWVVYPDSRTVYVYHSASDVQILHESETLEGSDIVPGFSVKISEIFAVLDE